MRLVGLEVPALDAQVLDSLAGFAEGLGRPARPQASAQLPDPISCHDPFLKSSVRSSPSQGLRAGGARTCQPTTATRRLPYDMAGMSVVLEEVEVAYAAVVSIPEALRAPGAPAQLRCVQRVALRRAAAELRLSPSPGTNSGPDPTSRRRRRVGGATAELAGLKVTYSERAVPADVQPGSPPHWSVPAVDPGSVAAGDADIKAGSEVVVRVLAIEHASLTAAAAGQPDGARPVRGRQEPGLASGLAGTVDVSGVRARFEAELVFAALQSAADGLAAARSVRKLLAARESAGADPDGSQPVSSSSPVGSRTVGHGAVNAAPDSTATSSQGQEHGGHTRPKRASLPDLAVTLHKAHAEIIIAQDIVWGASLGSARAEAATQSAALDDVEVTLNGRPIATVATAVVGVALEGGPQSRASPWGAPCRSAGDGAIHGQDHAAGPQATDGSREPTSASSVSPAAAASGPNRPFGRRCERLPAALRSAGIDSQGVQAQESNPDPAGPPAASSGAAVVVEAWLEDVAASVPHDQNFGTAERATELWAKAFRQVLSGSLAALRGTNGVSAAVDMDRSGAPAGGAAPGAQAPEASGRCPGSEMRDGGAGAGGAPLLELRVAARCCAFQMQHHPQEAWLAVHAPLLQRSAAARTLWSRMLAAVVPPAGGPLELGLVSGLGSPSPEGSPDRLARAAPGVQSRGSPASVGAIGDGCGGGATGAAAEALAAETAREYRRQCEQARPCLKGYHRKQASQYGV